MDVIKVRIAPDKSTETFPKLRIRSADEFYEGESRGLSALPEDHVLDENLDSYTYKYNAADDLSL